MASQACTSGICGYLCSSIGKKQLMGVTAFLLIGFLKAHLLGNFLLLLGPAAFNEYGHKLMSLGPLLIIAEIILLAIFLTHLVLAISLVWQNRKARPVKYYSKQRTGRGATFASNTMPYTGIVILIFICLHLWCFKYGTYYEFDLDGIIVRDLYRTVIEYFANPFYTAWYVLAMIAMGIHLSHGVQSAFQSVGFRHARYTPLIKKLGCALSLFLTVGFSGLSIYGYYISTTLNY